MNIISAIIDGMSVICGVTLDMIFGDKDFDYLFKQIKLQNLDEHRPRLRKVVKGANYIAYLFTIPIGLSIDDFEDNRIAIAQYLHKTSDDLNIDLVNSQALITVKQENKNVSYKYEDHEFDDELRIPLGIDLLTNRVVYWNFTEPNEAHLILGGTTGSGKSTMLRMMMCHITEHLSNLVELHMQDTKIVDLPDFKDTNCAVYYNEYKEGIYEELKSLVDEMNDRYKLMKKNKTREIVKYNKKVKDNKMKYKFLIIEELASFSVEDKADKENFYPKLTELLTKGRAAGILVIFTCQTPYNSVFPGSIKNNVNIKVGLACNTGEASKAICGDFDALTTLTGKGHGKLFSPLGITEFQGFDIQEETIEDIVSRNTKVVDEIKSENELYIGIKKGGSKNE